jgi:hypothetical protein
LGIVVRLEEQLLKGDVLVALEEVDEVAEFPAGQVVGDEDFDDVFHDFDFDLGLIVVEGQFLGDGEDPDLEGVAAGSDAFPLETDAAVVHAGGDVNNMFFQDDAVAGSWTCNCSPSQE